MKYKEFIILDVETTGVNSQQDDIIELAAVKVNALGKVVDKLDFLTSTPQILSPTIQVLTGITQADIEGKPPIGEMVSEVEKFVGDLPIIGHNIGFDIEFLINKGCNIKDNPALDTLELAYTVLPYQNFYRLEYLARHFNFPNQPAHRAMADVLATVDLFKLLVHQVADLQASTKEQINRLVGKDAWQWQWLFADTPNFGDERFKTTEDSTIADKLTKDIKQSNEYLKKIEAVKNDKVNFIETHFPISSLGLALSYAASAKPAILIVPEKLIKQLDWQSINNLTYDIYLPARLTYRENSEVELVESGISIGALEARIITKIIIWKNEWSLTREGLSPSQKTLKVGDRSGGGRDYAKLYLTREEEYQWEQKFSSLSPESSKADIVLASPTTILEMDVKDREVVVFEPLMIEDAEFRANSRLFSLNYFNAAISSRRDFVHQYIKPTDVKIADTAFKILNHVSSGLTKLSEIIIGIYRAYPPTSQWERNIELSEDVLNDNFREEIGGVIENLKEYLKLIQTAKAPANQQIAGTERLIDHLQALNIQRADYRYFLFADDSRFYLELVPSSPGFLNIRRIVDESKALTVLSPGLSIIGQFDYWEKYFGEFNSQIIGSAEKIELITADDANENPTRALINVVSQLALRKNEKSLVLAASGFEAKDIFTEIFDEVETDSMKLFSNDTAGTVMRIPLLLQDDQPMIYIGHYMWMHQAVWYAGGFDRVVLGKVPFEAVSRPQFKVLGDGHEGFVNYTLARTVFRLKSVLHAVSLLKKPICLIDARWYKKDYGQKIINSLVGFTVVPEPTDSLFS